MSEAARLSNYERDRQYVFRDAPVASGAGFVTGVIIEPCRADGWRPVKVEILVPIDGAIRDVLGSLPKANDNVRSPDNRSAPGQDSSLLLSPLRTITFDDQ